jgi:hypothetical protein
MYAGEVSVKVDVIPLLFSRRNRSTAKGYLNEEGI